jgi:hypothetical protein
MLMCDQLLIVIFLFQAISVEKRVGVAIWRLATANEYRTLQELFGLGRSTACQIVAEFIVAVCRRLKGVFLARPTDEQFAEIAEGFQHRWGFPQCVGAIDGSHIPIIAPQEHRNEYYNRKGWYSMQLQAVCDHRYRFWDIEVGWPGRAHDARVFSNSGLFHAAQDGTLFPPTTKRIGQTDVPLNLIGDPAYPLLDWLMKPYPGAALDDDRTHYNYRQSRARMCIENAFGRLKGRWRCLRKDIENHTSLVPSMILACCILHNICELRCENYNERLQQADEKERVQPPRRIQHAVMGNGRQVRDAICEELAAEM